jgi:hypothetical protein
VRKVAVVPSRAALPAPPSRRRVPWRRTSPLASRVTGVLGAFRVNWTVIPLEIVMVVKLKIPLRGSGTV